MTHRLDKHGNLRCNACNTILLRIQDGCIILIPRHHGKQHINVIPIVKLVEWAGMKDEVRYIRHNLTEHGGEVTRAVSKVIILSDDEIRVIMADGDIVTASGCSPRMMGEMRKAWPDAEDLRKESPDDPKRTD